MERDEVSLLETGRGFAKDGDDEITSKVNVGENITNKLCAECDAV